MSNSDAGARMEKARQVHLRKAAERALDDPVKLERAARIVRIALERRRLRLADLTSDAPENDGGYPDAA